MLASLRGHFTISMEVQSLPTSHHLIVQCGDNWRSLTAENDRLGTAEEDHLQGRGDSIVVCNVRRMYVDPSRARAEGEIQ